MSVLATYSYTLIDNSTHYSVTCTNTSVCTEAIIPSEYNGKPVTEIGSFAFMSSPSLLTNVLIPDSIVSIGSYAFCFCNSLTRLTLPNRITNIGEYAFAYSGLESINIPESLITLGPSIFDSCTNLASVTIPDGLSYIDTNVFSGCSKLTSITLPPTILSIGYHSFYNCSELTNIILGNAIASIGEGVFAKCSKLQTISVVNPNPATLGNEVFSNTPATLRIIVPDEGLSAYKVAANWNEYSNKIEGKPKNYFNFIKYANYEYNNYLADKITELNNTVNTYINNNLVSILNTEV